MLNKSIKYLPLLKIFVIIALENFEFRFEGTSYRNFLLITLIFKIFLPKIRDSKKLLTTSTSGNSGMTDSNFKKIKNTQKIGKKFFIHKIFTSVSKKYDLMNDIMSLGLHRSWKNEVISHLDINNKSTILDLATGSGDIIKRIKERGDCQCIGLDSNLDMLKVAKSRLKNYQLDFINANAENLPFKNYSFDYVIVSFGLRNFHNISKSLDQIFRVLKKNGKFVCLEFSEVNNIVLRKIINIYYKAVPFIGSTFANNETAYKYLIDSIKKFPNQIQLSQSLKKAGFKRISVIDIIDGIASIHISEK